MKKDLVFKITSNAIVATIYFLLTLLTSPFSFLGIQVRIAEALVLLCFFRKDFIFGLSLGCALVNIISPMGGLDVLFGTLATILSCCCIIFSKHLGIAVIFPIIFNSFIIGAELFFILKEPFWVNFGFVALGEFLSMVFGYFLFRVLGKQKFFLQTIHANQNIDFKW